MSRLELSNNTFSNPIDKSKSVRDAWKSIFKLVHIFTDRFVHLFLLAICLSVVHLSICSSSVILLRRVSVSVRL